jgi:hypothetical protein
VRPTVALGVPHGFTARMFLRSTVLEELLRRVERVGVFAPPESLEQLRRELPQPRLEFYPLHAEERRRDVLANFIRLLLADWRSTPTRMIREQEEWRANPWRRALWPVHKRVGGLAPLRRAWYRAENRLLPDSYHAASFRALRPDVAVTPTPGVLPADIRLLRRAASDGVRTVTFVQGWDNLSSKTIIGARPDRLLVWTERMRVEATTLHGFRPGQVAVTGAPHFDPYVTREGWLSRSRFLESIGLDPAKKLIVYATSPYRYFPETDVVLDLLVAAQETGQLPRTQIAVRLHPEVLLGRHAEDLRKWDRFRGRVYLDVPRGATGLAADYTPDGIRHLGQLVDAAAVTINVASSFTLDAAVLDRPIVNVRFDGARQKPYLQSVRRHYDTDHYLAVLRTGAVRLADSPRALVEEVGRYLADGSLERSERADLVRELCGQVDGRAGVRVAEEIAGIGARARGRWAPLPTRAAAGARAV